MQARRLRYLALPNQKTVAEQFHSSRVARRSSQLRCNLSREIVLSVHVGRCDGMFFAVGTGGFIANLRSSVAKAFSFAAGDVSWLLVRRSQLCCVAGSLWG